MAAGPRPSPAVPAGPQGKGGCATRNPLRLYGDDTIQLHCCAAAPPRGSRTRNAHVRHGGDTDADRRPAALPAALGHVAPPYAVPAGGATGRAPGRRPGASSQAILPDDHRDVGAGAGRGRRHAGVVVFDGATGPATAGAVGPRPRWTARAVRSAPPAPPPRPGSGDPERPRCRHARSVPRGRRRGCSVPGDGAPDGGRDNAREDARGARGRGGPRGAAPSGRYCRTGRAAVGGAPLPGRGDSPAARPGAVRMTWPMAPAGVGGPVPTLRRVEASRRDPHWARGGAMGFGVERDP